MIVMIVGSTGAGKTTYARKLSQEITAVVYSIDHWMKKLYGDDMPIDPKPDWFHQNHAWYLESPFWPKTILDLGFSTEKHRQKFISKFLKQKREKGDIFVMTVDDSLFECNEPNEPHRQNTVRVLQLALQHFQASGAWRLFDHGCPLQ